MNTNGSINKDKGMQTQVYDNGEKCSYSLLTMKVSPSPMLHNGSIYSPQLMGNGASNQSIYMHMEGQGSRYLLLDEKRSIFLSSKLNVHKL